jgi:N-acetylmuramoyl-L-alanine amidase
MLALALLGLAGGGRTEAVVQANAARSALVAGWFGRSLALDLHLEAAVRFRVFTLDAPPRLVVDFEGLDWAGFEPGRLAPEGRLRVGRIGPGWGRLVLDLEGPLALESAELVPDAPGMRLEVRLGRVAAERFAALSGAPPGVWPSGAAASAPEARGAGAVTVAIDPGHGGIDPGALRAGVSEKDVALAFAEALRDQLVVDGFRVVLTREGDDFVALDERVARARAAGADLFLSIHSNVVDDPGIAGAIAFTRSERGSSRAAAVRAAQENRADGLAAVPRADPVRAVLGDLARRGTDERSARLAEALVAALAGATGVAAGGPRQSADFDVLGAPDLPSVLLEIGFLSNPDERADLLSRGWRARAAAAVGDGIESWVAADRCSEGSGNDVVPCF